MMFCREPDSQNYSNGPKVIAVPKPGKDGSDLAQYRPISLMSVMYKLFELLILQRI
jgi:hypothetical protein